MENAENGMEQTQVKEDVTERGIYSEGEESGGELEANSDVVGERTDGGDDQASGDEVDALAELCRVSGRSYKSIEEFPEHERFLQLMDSGVLTSEEAFYAVNRGKTAFKSVDYDGKRHMVSTVKKPSSGEVFSRADREELAKWGISATGSELERLWREAGAR